MLTPLKFQTLENQDFCNTLKTRVRDYFKTKDLSIHSNLSMKLKTVAVITVWVGAYVALIAGLIPSQFNYFLWVILGLSVALVTMNVGHDAIHGAYSGKKWVNDLLSHTFSLNGASVYMWKKMHNVAHHTYTNVPGYDEDIAPASIIRVSPEAELKPVHKFQHIYSFVLYTLSTISWVFVKDYVKFFKNEVGNYNNKTHKRKEYFFLFFYKMIAYTLFWILPFLLINDTWYHILIGIVSMYLVSGFYLSLVFMLAHAVEEMHFPTPNIKGTIENQWLVHQLYTTSNFCSSSPLAAFLTGGLNQQIEHHLFPNICSIHYPELSKIVKETTTEFGIPYREFKGFGNALLSHYKFLKAMGNGSYTTHSHSEIANKLEVAAVL
jgi:linoleoyl-CoA desaturase